MVGAPASHLGQMMQVAKCQEARAQPDRHTLAVSKNTTDLSNTQRLTPSWIPKLQVPEVRSTPDVSRNLPYVLHVRQDMPEVDPLGEVAALTRGDLPPRYLTGSTLSGFRAGRT